LINGEWTDAANGKTIDLTNPATGKVFTQVASAGPEDIARAVKAAKDALEGAWGEVLPAQRARLMHRFADKLEEHAEELATIESNDNGKPIAMARKDAGGSAACIRHFASLAQSIDGKAFECSHNPNQLNYIRREPVGVCGAITPWNYPMLMTAFKIGPMLASGCTGVFKVAELTPLSGLKMGQLWNELEGTIPGVINVVPGLGGEAG